MVFQRRAVQRQQRFPAVSRRHDGRAVVRRLGELVCHLEEQQQRQLLYILEAREAGVLQHAGIAPGAFADLGGVHQVLSVSSSGGMRGCSIAISSGSLVCTAPQTTSSLMAP
jgi:hypothetical protein